jgi:hypothetical protein
MLNNSNLANNMNKKTFKTFFEEESDSSFSDMDLRNIAEHIVDGGYLNNFKEMAQTDSWLWRGSFLLGDKLSNNGGVLHQPPRKADRISTYGHFHLIHDIWHLEKMPSRKRAIFASFDSIHAHDFGKLVLLIPQDDTMLTGIGVDLNMSSEEHVQKIFGVDETSFGDVSEILDTVAAAIDGSANDLLNADDPFLEISHKFYVNLAQLTSSSFFNEKTVKETFGLFDKMISFLKGPEKKYQEILIGDDKIVKNVINKMYDGYVSKDKSSYNAIKDLLNLVKQDIKTSKSPAQLKSLIATDTLQSEVWWEGDSLVLGERFEKRLANRELLRYVEKYKASGFPPRATTVKRAKT